MERQRGTRGRRRVVKKRMPALLGAAHRVAAGPAWSLNPTMPWARHGGGRVSRKEAMQSTSGTKKSAAKAHERRKKKTGESVTVPGTGCAGKFVIPLLRP